jgi:hypothetical protein
MPIASGVLSTADAGLVALAVVVESERLALRRQR